LGRERGTTPARQYAFFPLSSRRRGIVEPY
jgi:hypothetical protein